MWERGIRCVWCDFVGKERDVTLVETLLCARALCSLSRGFHSILQRPGVPSRDLYGRIGHAQDGGF